LKARKTYLKKENARTSKANEEFLRGLEKESET